MEEKKEVTIQEIQSKLLEILLYFQKFCQENGLGFVLAGGTCLGAVRHKGFIPWDDDVDVFMLRDDYEKLCLSGTKGRTQSTIPASAPTIDSTSVTPPRRSRTTTPPSSTATAQIWTSIRG